MSERCDSLARALEAYSFDARARTEQLTHGLIHQTYVVYHGAKSAILQRIHPDFGPNIQENIERVTAQLEAKGINTPRLFRDRNGSLTCELGEAGSWRLMTRLEGTAYQRCESRNLAKAGGELVARFHGALEEFSEPLLPLGFPFHDWDAHRDDLIRSLEEERGHRLYEPAHALANGLLEASPDWETLGPLPGRVVHGDLKFNNLLFEGSLDAPIGHALIDLDTVGRRPLFIELGDAWRSWCGPGSDESQGAEVNLELFAASIEGYLGTDAVRLAGAELRSLAYGLERISLELAIRFAADILRERYWAWDETRYPSRGDHNLARAEAQWRLFLKARELRPEFNRILGVSV
jgi:Ser/Thr protein kinase RdoA (MazF antagonist)